MKQILTYEVSYHDRCKILNENLVLVATNFQYRVEIFEKLFVVDGPLGKIKYLVT